jgi:hypothetical protein
MHVKHVVYCLVYYECIYVHVQNPMNVVFKYSESYLACSVTNMDTEHSRQLIHLLLYRTLL